MYNAQILRLGDRGQAVKALQKDLILLGYKLYGRFNGADGIFGSTTHAAVIDFQKRNDLIIDGVVGVNTHKVLQAKISKIPQFVSNVVTIAISGPTSSGKSHIMAVIEKALKAEYGPHTQVASRDISMERGSVSKYPEDLNKPKSTTIFHLVEVNQVKGK